MYAAPKHTSQTSFKCLLPIILSVLFSSILLSQKTFGQGMTSVTVSPTLACAGTNLIVTFSSNASGSKTYKANLSDATGSFATSVTITLGTFDAPTNQTVTIAIPSTATTSSLYKVRVFASSVNALSSSAFTINAVSVGGSVSSSTTVCSGSNSGTLTLSGQTGSVVRWESSTDGGTTWSPIANTTTSQTYTNLTQTTMYRAVVQSGSCSIANSTSGTITVNPNATITLTSAGGTNPQTTCINTAITNITYSIGGGGTGAGITGLPAGVTGTYSGGVFTISGTPTAAGTFNYTVTTTGTCTQTIAAGTIIVNPNATITLTSATGTNTQTNCANTAITNITYSIGSGGTGAGVTGLPEGVIGTYSGGVITIGGTPMAAGIFNYTVTTTGTCTQATATGTITVNSVAVGGTTSPNITTDACYGSNSGSITLSGQTGSVIRWESSINGGTTWSSITNTTTAQTYTNLTQNTLYRAVVQSGVCTATAYSTNAVIVVSPTFVPTAIASPGTMCLGSSSTFTASGYTVPTTAFSGGDFNTANPAGWRVTLSGGEINFPANADDGNNNPWSETNGPKTFNGITYNNSPLTGKFAIATGWDSTTLETPIFNTVNMTSASFDFYQAYNLNSGTAAKVEISTDGGITYTPLYRINGPASYGIPNGGFAPKSISLTDYLGLSNLRLRFTFLGTAGSNWAIDNAFVNGTYSPVSYLWTPSTYLSVNTGTTVTATPTTSGTFTYTVTGKIGTCTAGNANVTITVNPIPNAVASPFNQIICSGSSVNPISFSGNVNATTYNWTRDNTTNVTGIAASSSGAITGVLMNTTSVHL